VECLFWRAALITRRTAAQELFDGSVDAGEWPVFPEFHRACSDTAALMCGHVNQVLLEAVVVKDLTAAAPSSGNWVSAPSAPPCIRHLRRPVTGVDLHGAPDLVRAPQRLAGDTAPVSVNHQ
jgi:hypothetical protein